LLRTATSVVVDPSSVDSDSFAERAAGEIFFFGKVKIEFSENVLACGVKECIKAVLFLKIRPHGSSIA
jgi:hypothetical protein